MTIGGNACAVPWDTYRLECEMVYIGGGRGTGAFRAHLSHLFESEGTSRMDTYWYGARHGHEIFYADYFGEHAKRHPHYAFHLALSTGLPEDKWTGHIGRIHEVARGKHLHLHSNNESAEYYLYGRPMLIKACTKMPDELGVPSGHIAYAEC